MFLPTTKEELKKLGWSKLDIILITGDAYIDSPYVGVSVIGKTLLKAGYKVGIIAQPDVNSAEDISRLGEPKLFWGVSAGCIESMVSNYTATKKRRKKDDFTPGGENVKRPDRSVIAYSNLIRKFFKNTKPIVLGGIEASLRRIPHYDYWDNKIRRSILFDSKADLLVYGMGEKTVLELADKLQKGDSVENIRGLCYISKTAKEGYIILPPYEEVKTDKNTFIDMFNIFYNNNDPITANGLCQKQDTRYLIQNPSQYNLNSEEFSNICNLPYERDVHPYYKKDGAVRALETIRFSVNTHRGCYGQCNFCSISVHQGTTVISRTVESILTEIEEITKLQDFKGYISDLGGPTANMYAIECEKKLKNGQCREKKCLHPKICENLKISHKKQLELLSKIRNIPKIKKVFIASGIRYDMLMNDKECMNDYMKDLVLYHISGQLKIAPEHTEDKVLKIMGKTSQSYLCDFKDIFDRLNKQYGKEQFLTYYLIAAHPGCEINDMNNMKKFIIEKLKLIPEQIQIFTPSPSTYSTLMYYTETDPFTKEKIFVEKDLGKKELQKRVIRR